MTAPSLQLWVVQLGLSGPGFQILYVELYRFGSRRPGSGREKDGKQAKDRRVLKELSEIYNRSWQTFL